MTFPIYLIGARGCGKTTVGQYLAQQLGYHFQDTDRYVQALAGDSIAGIVKQQGWQHFRQLEQQALQAVSHRYTVVATGGGIVLDEQSCRFMRESGQVIWLQVPLSQLVQRLHQSPETEQRPTLTGANVMDEMQNVLQARLPLYQHTSHHHIDATGHPQQIANQIVQLCQLSNLAERSVSHPS